MRDLVIQLPVYESDLQDLGSYCQRHKTTLNEIVNEVIRSLAFEERFHHPEDKIHGQVSQVAVQRIKARKKK